jgi:BirA family biotin operon repressor/biotin-[acetyl-CoA-carboxylase] ligase
VAAGARRLAVIGVGLNVLPIDASQATSGVACVQELDPDVTAPQVLSRVAPPLGRGAAALRERGLRRVRRTFCGARRAAAARRAHHPPRRARGVALGVAPDGALRVQTPDGSIKNVASGEVSVRLNPHA